MATTTPPLELGATATDFYLPAVDGQTYTLKDCLLPKAHGLVIVFICNHCPYVKAITKKLIIEANALKEIGISMVAINSNDSTTYHEDDFSGMIEFAKSAGFNFPYLHDKSQELAKAYKAVCTPDFFGYLGDDVDALTLQYRGRLDNTGKVGSPPKGQTETRELYRAMQQLVESGKIVEPQYPSLGCSIKWING